MDSKKEINRQSRRKALMTLAAVAGTSALGVVGNNLYSKNEDQILNSDTLPLFSIRNMKSGQLTTFNNETKQKAFSRYNFPDMDDYIRVVLGKLGCEGRKVA